MTDTSLSDALLQAIDANEGYWLPVGFEDEALDTKLHRAIRHLILINAVKAECHGAFNRWMRAKLN
jgi:hypothetical protein